MGKFLRWLMDDKVVAGFNIEVDDDTQKVSSARAFLGNSRFWYDAKQKQLEHKEDRKMIDVTEDKKMIAFQEEEEDDDIYDEEEENEL